MVFLDSIVGQMDEFVIEIFHVEFFGGSTDISVLIPVTFLISVDARHTDIGSDVEFAFLVEEWHDVFLDDVGTSSTHFVSFVAFDDLNDLIDAFDYLDACSSVCVLAWFHKPSISFFSLEAMLKLLVLLFLLLVFDELSTLLVLFLELCEFLIVEIGHMEGHWNVLERVYLLGIVVILKIHEKRLLIGEVPVIGKMVVNAEIIRTIFVSLHLISSHLCLYLSLLADHLQLL